MGKVFKTVSSTKGLIYVGNIIIIALLYTRL